MDAIDTTKSCAIILYEYTPSTMNESYTRLINLSTSKLDFCVTRNLSKLFIIEDNLNCANINTIRDLYPEYFI